MSVIASQITSLTIVYSIVYSDADQRKHQSSASLAFVRGINRGPVNSPHNLPVTGKIFPFDDVIMNIVIWVILLYFCFRCVCTLWVIGGINLASGLLVLSLGLVFARLVSSSWLQYCPVCSLVIGRHGLLGVMRRAWRYWFWSHEVCLVRVAFIFLY